MAEGSTLGLGCDLRNEYRNGRILKKLQIIESKWVVNLEKYIG
jgi:hypothetical protein